MADILQTSPRTEADQKWIWEISVKDRPCFAFMVADLKNKNKNPTTNHELMWAFAAKAASGAQGTRLAEWMFPLKPTKKTGGSEKRVSCRTGKHSGMGEPNRME